MLLKLSKPTRVMSWHRPRNTIHRNVGSGRQAPIDTRVKRGPTAGLGRALQALSVSLTAERRRIFRGISKQHSCLPVATLMFRHHAIESLSQATRIIIVVIISVEQSISPMFRVFVSNELCCAASKLTVRQVHATGPPEVNAGRQRSPIARREFRSSFYIEPPGALTCRCRWRIMTAALKPFCFHLPLQGCPMVSRITRFYNDAVSDLLTARP